MKKLYFAIMALATIMLVGCEDKGNETELTKNGEVKKVADYLYEYTAVTYGTQAPSFLMMDEVGRFPFGCSSVRNGNFYGRNFDYNINELCEFVVYTQATKARKHASIGVVNPLFYTITNDMVKAGLHDSILNYLPWLTMDGINDKGLVCNINVVNAADIKATPHTHTNEGAPKIMIFNLVRALLDNCGSVKEAKDFILAHDILPIPVPPSFQGDAWDGHIMIADPNETVIVEFAGGEQPVKFVTQEKPIMTNFYNHLFDEKTKAFPKYVCGMERYNILEKDFATATSMQGMWNLLKKVQYTQAYQTTMDPFWCSEFFDKIPTYDGDYVKWNMQKVLAEKEPANEVKAYYKYLDTGEYNLNDGLWFTTHNTTFDIANKTIWVTIREKYEKHYEFNL